MAPRIRIRKRQATAIGYEFDSSGARVVKYWKNGSPVSPMEQLIQPQPALWSNNPL